jgi:hypothetical protein
MADKLELLVETTTPSGKTVRVFRDREADKLVTFGGDAPKVSALDSDKPKPLGVAWREFVEAMKEINDAAREIGMSNTDRANLALNMLSLIKKGPAK